MITWTSTVKNEADLPFTNADVLPLVLALHALAPLTLLRFERRPDLRFNFVIDCIDGRQWREVIDLTPAAPGFSVDPGGIVGGWLRAEICALMPLRDALVGCARTKGCTLIEFAAVST